MRAGDAAVAAQMTALAGLAWPGRARWRLPPVVTAGAAGLVLAGGALGAATARQHGAALTPRVAPPGAARLLVDGPYRWSRHPMYGGLLLAASGVAVLRRRPEPLVALAVLAAVLHVKTGLEERALRERFGEAYDRYAARVPRLVGVPGRGARQPIR